MSLISQARLIDLQKHADDRGHLVVVESNCGIPFDIKRLFYIYGTKPTAVRGQHANRKSEFLLVALSGSCSVKIDDGMHEEVFVLDNPGVGLYIPKMLWKEMFDFSPDCVLLSISNELYDSEEYIRDYESYREIMATSSL